MRARLQSERVGLVGHDRFMGDLIPAGRLSGVIVGTNPDAMRPGSALAPADPKSAEIEGAIGDCARSVLILPNEWARRVYDWISRDV